MKNKNIRINNEFYLDMAMKEIIDKKLKIYNLEVKKYKSFGTPEEINLSN